MLNVFLQLLDDGVLTDGLGRTVDFKNTVIIMTSNLGAEHLIGGNTMKVAHDLLLKQVCETETSPPKTNPSVGSLTYTLVGAGSEILQA